MTRTAPSPAAPATAASTPWRIAVVAFDGISPFHLSVPCMVFGEDRSRLGVPRFEVTLCAVEKAPLRTSAGFAIDGVGSLAALQRADVVIVPSWYGDYRPAPPALLSALRRAAQRGAWIVGLCLGAFPLAEAGLLDGRRATTHWACADDLHARHPAVEVDRDVLYVDEGKILTSAGVAAGIDCCLHLMRRLHGAEAANRVARWMVVAPHRQGGQAQFIEQPVPQSNGDDRMASLLDWIGAHLAQPHSVDALAARVAMSRRSFTRHFRQATGTTVVQWLLHQRLALAQRLLEGGDLPVERIAQEAGFGSALSLRQHFRAAFGTAPLAWRRQFRRAA